MANTVRLKRSAVQGKVPTTSDLSLGEIALNTYDGKLFIKKNDGSDSIVEIGGGSSASATTSDSAPSSPSDGDLWYRSSDGRLYVYYDDGNTAQWVDANPNLPPASDTFSRSGTTVSLVNAGDALSIDGSYRQTAEAVAALDIDCSTGNYFTKAISADSTFTFSNVPATGTAYSFVIEIEVTGDRTIQWPGAVKFNGDSAPLLTADRTHLFMFVTDDGGTRWRGSALVDYVD